MSVDLLFSQAHAALRAGRFPEAERRYKALVRVRPLWAWHNLGVLYVTTGRFREAEAAFRQALQIDPDAVDTQHSLAMLTLGEGRYAEGWRLYESRRRVPSLKTPAPRLSFPEWRGEDLAGKRLLVIREQGLGDQIMMARFVKPLEARGARVTYLCDAPLAPLFAANGIDAVAAVPGAQYPTADYWTLMFSLPALLGLELAHLDGAPYLAAEPRGSGGVGVKVRGGTAHRNDRNRSLSGEAAARIGRLGRDLDPASTGAKDFLETAEIIAGLDLVIGVDTAVAHLAGALGKPVWILLSALETDWRWLRRGETTPWYASARLYRQSPPGNWGPLVKKVVADLEALGAP